MAEYMTDVMSKTGYESLKSQYMKKYPVLGQKTDTCAMNSPEDVIDGGEESDDAFDKSEVANLKEKMTSMEREYDDNRKCLEQRLHQTKRTSDLARNKILTATECLDMFLVDYLKNNNIDEFDPSFKFLVTQYSSLLFTPKCYSVDTENCQVVLSETLFSNIAETNSDISEKIDTFKNHLKEKLSLDFSVRRERRLSMGSGSIRSRIPSVSIKRSNDEQKGNASKCSRPSQSS